MIPRDLYIPKSLTYIQEAYVARISLPTPLRPYANKQAMVEVPGDTVGELLEGLMGRFPDLKQHLLAENGSLRSFVNVYVNEEDIRHLQRNDTAIQETDLISIVPSIAGGCAT